MMNQLAARRKGVSATRISVTLLPTAHLQSVNWTLVYGTVDDEAVGGARHASVKRDAGNSRSLFCPAAPACMSVPLSFPTRTVLVVRKGPTQG
jgi:hypothetical protein